MNEPKKWVEIALMPLVVAVVGIIGTYLIANEQREAAKIRAEADRQIKILDIFGDKIFSAEERERLIAARLAIALDNDLALKLMTVFDTTTEQSEEVRKVVESLTTHTILSKQTEGKTGPAYQQTYLEGHWNIHSSRSRDVNWLKFKIEESALKVHGNGWKGDVTFDGKHGYYLWKYDERGWTGRTDFYIDDTGILFGKVKGDDNAPDTFDWTYWGTRAQSIAVASEK